MLSREGGSRFNKRRVMSKIDRWLQKRRSFFQPAGWSGQGFSRGLETGKIRVRHFFGMKPRLTKVVKESFC